MRLIEVRTKGLITHCMSQVISFFYTRLLSKRLGLRLILQKDVHVLIMKMSKTTSITFLHTHEYLKVRQKCF